MCQLYSSPSSYLVGSAGWSWWSSGGCCCICSHVLLLVRAQAAQDIFGYSKAEMCGKNVNMLLPSKIAEAHTAYVRNYIATGRETVMNKTVQQVAMHKDHHLIPITLSVTRVSGIGEDTLFMEVIEVSAAAAADGGDGGDDGS
jgi:PAS domain S-box-containing protein